MKRQIGIDKKVKIFHPPSEDERAKWIEEINWTPSMQTFKHQNLFPYTKARTRYFLFADFFLLDKWRWESGRESDRGIKNVPHKDSGVVKKPLAISIRDLFRL